MALWPRINRFNAGEWSPLLDGRWDLEDYQSALRKCNGFIPLKYGPLERSTGTEYIAETKDSTKESRLVRFRFSATTNYVMEFGDQYIRWYTGGSTASRVEISTPSAWTAGPAYSVGDLVVETGTNYYCTADHTPGTFATDLGNGLWHALEDDIYEIPTTYQEAVLFDLQFVQINDLIYIVHEDYPVRKLSRYSNTDWRIENVDWDFPPLLDINTTSTTIYPSATTGTGITLNASADTFTADDVEAYYAITQSRDGQEITFDSTTANKALSAAIPIGTYTVPTKGAWSITTSGFWDGRLTISKRQTSTTNWTEVWSGTSDYSGAAGANFIYSGTEPNDDMEYTLDFQHGHPTAGAAPSDASAIFTVEPIDITGFAQITGYTSATQVTADVKKNFEKSGSGNAVTTWTEGAFSYKRGWPGAVTFFESRLIFGGTDYRKQRMWFSSFDNFENFGTSTPDLLATDSLSYQLASVEQNRIKWIRARKYLLIGTEGEEYSLRGADGNALSPTTQPLSTIESTEGSKGIRPTIVGDSLLFWSRDGRKLHELLFSIGEDGFGTNDITKLAEHITDPSIKQSAYTQDPYRILWNIRTDGVLVGLVYNRTDEVIAWFTRDTDGEFESVESIYGDPEDEVWVIVKRTVNGADVRYIERFSFRQAVKDDMLYADCGIRYSGASTTTITGLDHLEGKTVTVLADGNVETDKVVSSGQITLDNASTKASVGLAYDTEMETTKLEAPAGDGASRAKPKKTDHVLLGFQNSLGGEVGIRWNSPGGEEKEILNEVTFRDTSDVMDSSPPLFTGEKYWEMPTGHHRNPRIVYKQTQPLPCTLLYTIPKITPKGP